MDAMPRGGNNGFYTANGQERITLDSGAQIKFKTRTKKSGRGPSPDAIIFDEAMELDKRALGALTPSLSARRKAMLVFTSSSPREHSSELWRLRRRAIAGDGGRLFYAGWNTDPDVDPCDERNWFACNPSLGLGSGDRPGKEIDAMRADLDLLPADEFAIEHLGVPEEPEGENDSPIPLDRWEQLADGDSMASEGTVRLSLDVSTDRRFSTFGIAGHRADRLGHVAVRDRRPGTDWVVERARVLAEGHNCPVIIATNSPASSFIEVLESAGVAVDVMSPAEYGQACARFIDATRGEQPRLRHRGDPNLRAALASAQVKDHGDGGVIWSRRSTKSSDIAPLTTVTMAWGRVDRPAAAVGSYSNLSDYLEDE